MPAPTDPWSAGIMAAGSVIGSAFQKAPTNSTANQQSSFDASGWNVNVNSDGAKQTSSGGGKALGAIGGAGSQVGRLLDNPLVIVGVCVALYFYMKK